MDSLKSTLGNNFPELIVTEFLPGDEYSVDVLRNSNRIIVIPRERNKVRSGITFHGTVIENEKIIEYCTLIAKKLDLKNCFGFQFKIDKNGIPKILESNPRIQGTMILSTLAGANIIYASIKDALRENYDEFNIKWGTKFIRYWGGVGVTDKITKI